MSFAAEKPPDSDPASAATAAPSVSSASSVEAYVANGCAPVHDCSLALLRVGDLAEICGLQPRLHGLNVRLARDLGSGQWLVRLPGEADVDLVVHASNLQQLEEF